MADNKNSKPKNLADIAESGARKINEGSERSFWIGSEEVGQVPPKDGELKEALARAGALKSVSTIKDARPEKAGSVKPEPKPVVSKPVSIAPSVAAKAPPPVNLPVSQAPTPAPKPIAPQPIPPPPKPIIPPVPPVQPKPEIKPAIEALRRGDGGLPWEKMSDDERAGELTKRINESREHGKPGAPAVLPVIEVPEKVRSADSAIKPLDEEIYKPTPIVIASKDDAFEYKKKVGIGQDKTSTVGSLLEKPEPRESLPPPQVPPPPTYPDVKKVSSLKTYSEDTLRTAKVVPAPSKAEQYLKNQKAKEGVEEVREEETYARNTMLITISVVLVLAGIGILAFMLFVGLPRAGKAPTSTSSSLISSQTREEIVLTGAGAGELAQQFSNIQKQSSSGITEVAWVVEEGKETRTATVPELFTALRMDIPGTLIRALDKKYMVGIYTNTDQVPFIALSIASFDRAYASALSWESGMPANLAPLFGESVFAGKGAWRDVLIKNKDTRVLEDGSGGVVLIYSFLDKGTLVITKDRDTMEGLIDTFTVRKQ